MQTLLKLQRRRKLLTASKNFIANIKKQKHENKSLLFLDNVKIIKDAILNRAIEVQCILTSLENLPLSLKSQKFFTQMSEQSSNLQTLSHHRKYYALHTSHNMLWKCREQTFWCWTACKTQEMSERLFAQPKGVVLSMCFWWTP